MHVIFSLLAVVALIAIAYAGVAGAGLTYLFGVVIPYAAVITFFVGLILKVLDWGRSAVPFCIPTTCGQQKTLSWIKPNKIDNPTSSGAVMARMFFEVVTMRSLFRNTKLDYRVENGQPVIRQGSERFLWLFAILFHYSFLVVLLWHLRFFMDPVPKLVGLIESLDGFFEVGLPQVLISGIILVAMAGALLDRRLRMPNIRYISLTSDYFPLFLIMGIGITGILMRYFLRVDVEAVKELTMSLATMNPVIPATPISPLFYAHIFLVSVLFAYFPFSKLMHMPGVFMSPTRNLPTNSREVRHVNPWNYPVKTHTYDEYEDDFRDLMIEAGLPVEHNPAEEEAAAAEGAEGAEAEGEPAAEAPAEEPAEDPEEKKE
jgi:nitrate reductase gamma subunit